MNKFYHQLNEGEKFIIENHFIHNKESSKQNFQKFCIDIISLYTGKLFDYKKQDITDRDYSIELIWDKENNQTAMMHCFSHSKFKLSNGKMKSFAIFNGDLNFLNKDKQNALMVIIKNSEQTYAIKSLLQEESGFDLKLLDINNNSVHIYVLEKYNIDTFGSISFDNDCYFSFLGKLELFTNVVKEWINADIKKSKRQNDLVVEKTFSVVDGLKIMLEKSKDSIKDKYGYLEGMLLPEIKNIESIARMIQLQNNLQINNIPKVKRKI